MISTSSLSISIKKIANLSQKFGAEIFKRSKTYPDDNTGTNEVICEVIDYYEPRFNLNKVCIYPTAVFCNKDLYLKSF